MSAVVTDDSTALREGAFGHATGPACRECGHQVELGPHYACPECFGPLEVAYDFPAVTREEIEAGPRNIWRYKALLPVPDRHRAEPQHRARLHPAAQGRTTSAASSASTSCGSRTTRPTPPTPSRTASWPAR